MLFTRQLLKRYLAHALAIGLDGHDRLQTLGFSIALIPAGGKIQGCDASLLWVEVGLAPLLN